MRHHSEETKKKMILARTGKHYPNLSKSLIGKHHIKYVCSEETKEKIRKSRLGKKFPNLSKARMGHFVSDEAKKKMSLAKKGKPSWNKGGKGHQAWNKGKKWSPEVLQKLSDSHKGKKMPLETRIKISNANKGKYFVAKGYSVDWTKTLRLSIKERDRFVCQICNDRQMDISFSVHHIDYDKKNCNPTNLMTLCKTCHTKTNHNRKYWQTLLEQQNKQYV